MVVIRSSQEGMGDPNPGAGAQSTWSALDQLPEDIARQIACENPLVIYRLAE